MEKPAPYKAYLIRLWPTRRGGVADYRVSIQSVATGQRSQCPDLNSLAEFLRSPDEGTGDETVRRIRDVSEGAADKEDD